MRLRNVKGSYERILEHPYTIQADAASGDNYKGLWNKNFFHNNNPIHIEIGMGKGQFITTCASQNPDINYIGIEKYSSVLVKALGKRDLLKTDNLLFIRMEAENITDFFAPGETDRIYLNFSDPWPKDRHAKRRLTSRQFMERYKIILSDNGFVQFKTDNRALFNFSIEEIKESGWRLDEIIYNLHKDGPAANNIMTEYEQKFYKLGNPIYKLTAYKPDNPAGNSAGAI